MAETKRLGLEAKLYLDADDDYDNPDWFAADRVKDLSEMSNWNTAPCMDRGVGVNAVAKTTPTLEVSGDIRVVDDDPGYIALYNAYLDRDGAIHAMVLNGPKDSNGARGFRAMWHVTEWGEAQGMEQVLYRTFKLQIAADDPAKIPQSVLVAGDVPVYTDFATPPE